MEFGVFLNILTSFPRRAKGNFANFSQGEGDVLGLVFFFSEQSLTTVGTLTKNRKHANAKQVVLISKDGIKLTANIFTKITSKQTLNTTGRR